MSSTPLSWARYRSTTSVISWFRSKRAKCMSGARAYSLNALTICFIASTCATIVCVARSRICASCAFMLPRNLRRMRSADSWIGVSGFLISCASRRATSAPGRIALRLQRGRDVVEHQHHARRAADVVRQRRAGAHEHALSGLGQQLDLLAPIELSGVEPRFDRGQELARTTRCR